MKNKTIMPTLTCQGNEASDDLLNAPSGAINGHEYVDLGLSVKWATCNVGASSPSGFGDCFAWGEAKPKLDYSSMTCKTYGETISNIGGHPLFDAARANWRGTWRMPMKAEIEELMSRCQWTWTTLRRHEGYKVTGPNGKSIFLPAAGWRYGVSLYGTEEFGFYWSATPDESCTQYAYSLTFSKGDFRRRWGCRYRGRAVRPVSD